MIGALEQRWQRMLRYFDRDLWQASEAQSSLVRIGRRALQLAVIVYQGVTHNHTMLRASALTYFSMLSLIPLFAVALALVKAFGPSDQIIALVTKQIATVSPDAGRWIAERVGHIEFDKLGGVGAATLLVTTVLALSNVEKALNFIWGVARQRPLVRRFPDYLAVVVVAPLLLGVAVTLRASLVSEAALEHDPLLKWLWQLPLLWAAFGFLYWFLPNTTVRPVPAIAGGALAAVLFAVVQEGYVRFQVGVANYNALFGGLAALPILLVWIYFSWAIVLVGAELAFALQNFTTFRQARIGEEPRPAEREAVGLAIATRLARGFRAGAGGMTAEDLATGLDVPVRTVRALLGDFEAAGLVAPRGDDKLDGFQLGRAAESIPVTELLAALRGPADAALRRVSGDPPLCQFFAELEGELGQLLRERSLADLAAGRVDLGIDRTRGDG